MILQMTESRPELFDTFEQHMFLVSVYNFATNGFLQIIFLRAIQIVLMIELE